MTSGKLTVKALEQELRAFRPKPPLTPFPLPTDGATEKTRWWFRRYLRRVSRRTYLNAVSVWVKENHAHWDAAIREVQNRLAAPDPKPALSLHWHVMFPPLTEEDLQSALCIKDSSLPVVTHVKPGAGRRPRGRASHTYVLIQKYWHEAEQKGITPHIHYVLDKLQKKRIPTGDVRYGSRWPELYEAQPERVWKRKQLAFSSRYAEID